MAVISIKSFGGISPKTPTRLLQDSQAQVAINCPVFAGTINPLPGLGSSVKTIPGVDTPQTIYRYGQNNTSDDKYWFSWPVDVDVCRGQIAGDQSEWTFYTGDGAPKATYDTIALSGDYDEVQFPTASRPLGLPMPSKALVLAAQTYTPESYPATITITADHVKWLSTTYGLKYSLTDDEDASYSDIALSGPITVESVAAAIDAKSGVSAEVVEGNVVVTTDATGEDAKLYMKGHSGVSVDTKGTFTYTGYDQSNTGGTTTEGFIVIEDEEIAAISAGHHVDIRAWAWSRVDFTGPVTASSLATLLNAAFAADGSYMVATVFGSCVALTSDEDTAFGYARYDSFNNKKKTYSAADSNNESPAALLLTQANLVSLQDKFISILIGDVEKFIPVPADQTMSGLARSLAPAGVTGTVYGVKEPTMRVTSNGVGPNVTMRIRGGTYPTTEQFAKLNAEGYDDTPDSTITRAYTWTWVNKESGYEFESMPYAPAVNDDPLPTVEAYFDQAVFLSGRPEVPVGYQATHWRLYRAEGGAFLFVDEIDITQNSYTDTVLAENLGEAIASTTWSPPPSDLRGLINLPNGSMAGFVGRDVYFCDPYHPHAWPQQYVQSMDYPVVGLGRMDTTLAVLTTGTPYFLQGSHPDSMTVVKTDLEQSCSSKRSIVSTNGIVVYASPDGLVMLSPSGSKLITEQLFTRAQWQTYFAPESIHAYSHDLKYVAFYDNGTTQGGFIFDPTSGQFIMHDIYTTAGYSDLLRDQLFLASEDLTIKPWIGGAAKNLTWRSKKFWMPKPLGYTCAQLEAEAYPVTLKVYVDGTLGHTATVADRAAFRLPVLIGRDWEFQIEGNTEVFSLAIAQSMEEIAGV